MSILTATGIKKAFIAGKDVLRDISFSMEKGDVLSIIGSSGSGKSTLLRCITQLETVDLGEIVINGRTLVRSENGKAVYADKKELKLIQQSVGMVFQSFNLFPHFTVLRNITDAPRRVFGVPKEEAEAQAMEILSKMDLADKAKSYPCELSGGQQQRVAIARALALRPDIICFDEPTSALDPELTGEVLKVIRDLKKAGHTMIVVTHEMEFARSVSDYVIFMADGIIEEQGTPEEVFGNPRSERARAFLSRITN